MAVLDRFFSVCLFVWGTKKVVTGHIRLVVVLYNNNCMRIGLGGLSTGCLIEVVVSAGSTVYYTQFFVSLKTTKLLFTVQQLCIFQKKLKENCFGSSRQ